MFACYSCFLTHIKTNREYEWHGILNIVAHSSYCRSVVLMLMDVEERRVVKLSYHMHWRIGCRVALQV
jgi:hypothetical protein